MKGKNQRKNIILTCADKSYENIITRDSEGFHFRDNCDDSEIWIAKENVQELIKFLTEE